MLSMILLASSGCTGNRSSLTDEQMSKLTPPLQQVVRGETTQPPPDLPMETTSDGTTLYLVLLRVDDAAAVRAAGIPLNSVHGSMATARLTVEQIRRAVTLESVSRIEHSGRTRSM
jgi:hypothetical protein